MCEFVVECCMLLLVVVDFGVVLYVGECVGCVEFVEEEWIVVVWCCVVWVVVDDIVCVDCVW